MSSNSLGLPVLLWIQTWLGSFRSRYKEDDNEDTGVISKVSLQKIIHRAGFVPKSPNKLCFFLWEVHKNKQGWGVINCHKKQWFSSALSWVQLNVAEIRVGESFMCLFHWHFLLWTAMFLLWFSSIFHVQIKKRKATTMVRTKRLGKMIPSQRLCFWCLGPSASPPAPVLVTLLACRRCSRYRTMGICSRARNTKLVQMNSQTSRTFRYDTYKRNRQWQSQEIFLLELCGVLPWRLGLNIYLCYGASLGTDSYRIEVWELQTQSWIQNSSHKYQIQDSGHE